MSDIKNFKRLVLELNKEFEEREGHVTCELSTTPDNIVEKYRFTQENAPENGYWMMAVCGTCIDHAETHPIHAEIVRIKKRS